MSVAENEADELTELKKALARSVDLVQQLQLLAGYVLAKPSALRANELAQQVVEAFLQAQPAAQLELICEPDLPMLQGDAKLLRQALSELLSNALESGPVAQTIRLRVAQLHDPSQVAGVVVQGEVVRLGQEGQDDVDGATDEHGGDDG